MPTDVIVCIDGLATGTGTEIPVTSFDRVGWSVVTSAGVSAGVVAFEWAQTSGYAGTWANIESITAAAASTAYMGTVSDVVAGFVRPRITTNITGGTVIVTVSRSNIGHY